MLEKDLASRVLLATIAAFGAAIFFSELDWCGSAGNAVSGGHQTGVCVEFWINRYQTLIAGIFALLAAGIAWRIAKTDRDARRLEALDRDIAQLRELLYQIRPNNWLGIVSPATASPIMFPSILETAGPRRERAVAKALADVTRMGDLVEENCRACLRVRMRVSAFEAARGLMRASRAMAAELIVLYEEIDEIISLESEEEEQTAQIKVTFGMRKNQINRAHGEYVAENNRLGAALQSEIKHIRALRIQLGLPEDQA